NDHIEADGYYQYGGGGNDLVYGGDGDDDIRGVGYYGALYSGSDQLYGDAGADTIYAGSNSTVYGGDDNDTINLSGANSKVYGGAGDDNLNGISGDGGLADTFYGDAGVDTFSIGAFYFNSGRTVDIIADFTAGPGGDRLDLSQLASIHGVSG